MRTPVAATHQAVVGGAAGHGEIEAIVLEQPQLASPRPPPNQPPITSMQAPLAWPSIP